MEYKIVSKNEIRIIGCSEPLSSNMEENFAVVPGVWGKATSEGLVEKMIALNDGEVKGLLGVTSYDDPSNMRYYLAVASNQPITGTLEEFVIPAADWAVFEGKGSMPNSIQELEMKIGTEWLPASEYQYAFGVDMEVYLNADPENATYEVWLPVVKKSK